MIVKKLHHVAYRCRDSQETVDFYERILGLRFWHAVREHEYRGKPCPFFHIFFKMGDGSSIAFFELPDEKVQQWDANTPRWVQHLALEVTDFDTLMAMKQRLEANGIEVQGPKVGSSTTHSIYFFDPTGNRLELATPRALDEATAARDAVEELRRWNEDYGSGKVA